MPPRVFIKSGEGQTARACHPQVGVAFGYVYVPWEMQVLIWVGEVTGSGRKRSLLRMREAAEDEIGPRVWGAERFC